MAFIEVADEVVFDAASVLLQNGFIVINITHSKQANAIIDAENLALHEMNLIEENRK